MTEMVGGCCVCSDERGWDENPLVYCDGEGCCVAVHQACYGIVTVPPGPWFCRKCELIKDRPAKVRCDLCPNKDGAFKKTDSGGWAHVVCALYIPEVRFENVTTMEPILTSLIPQERYNKSCYICETNKKPPNKASFGAFMECNKAGCRANFHVTCAQYLGLLCEEAGNLMDNVKYCGYCQYHSSKLKKTNHLKIIPPFKPSGSGVNNSSESPSSSPEKSMIGIGDRDSKGHGPSGSAGAGPANSNNAVPTSTTSTSSASNIPMNLNMNISPDITAAKRKSTSITPPNLATAAAVSRNLFATSTSSSSVSSATSGGCGSVDKDKAEILSLKTTTTTTTTTSNSNNKSSSSNANTNSPHAGKSSLPPPPDIKPHVTLTPIPMENQQNQGGQNEGSNNTKGQGKKGQSQGQGLLGMQEDEKNFIKKKEPAGKRGSRRGAVVADENSETDSATEVELDMEQGDEQGSLTYVFNPRTTSNSSPTSAYYFNTQKQNNQMRPPLSPTITNHLYKYKRNHYQNQHFPEYSVSSRDSEAQQATKNISPTPPVRKRGRRGSNAGPVIPPAASTTVTRQSVSQNQSQSNSNGLELLPPPLPPQQSQQQQQAVLSTSTPAPRHNLDDTPPTLTLSQLAQNSSNASSHPPHMFGNTLNPSSSMAQQMVDSLSQEIKTITAASIALAGNSEISNSNAQANENSNSSSSMRNLMANGEVSTNNPLVGVPFPGAKNSAPNLKPQNQAQASGSSSTGSGSVQAPTQQPQTLEDLLERQWDQGSQFLMEQAAHLDIAQLLSCLNQLKQDNRALEDHVATLCQRKEQLAAINARLNIPLSNNTQVYVPGLRGQGQHNSNSNSGMPNPQPYQGHLNRPGTSGAGGPGNMNGPPQQAHPQAPHYNENRGRVNNNNSSSSHHQQQQ